MTKPKRDPGRTYQDGKAVPPAAMRCSSKHGDKSGYTHLCKDVEEHVDVHTCICGLDWLDDIPEKEKTP